MDQREAGEKTEMGPRLQVTPWLPKRRTETGPPTPSRAKPTPPPKAQPNADQLFLQQILAKIPDKPFFRRDEVADLLGVCKSTIKNWIKDGKMREVALTDGHTLRVPYSEVTAFVTRYTVTGRK